MKLFIPVIIGTSRPKRESINVAQLLKEMLDEHEDVETAMVDPKDHDLSLDGNDEENKIDDYTQLIERADGLFLVVPEYNHSFPASLKGLLDKELGAYMHKPAAMAGVSGGGFGGVRAIESLLPVLRELGLVASSVDLIVSRVQDKFDDDGQLLDDGLKGSASQAIDELLWLAQTLRLGRDQEK